MTSSTRRAVHRIGVVAGAGILAVGLAGAGRLGDHGAAGSVRPGVGGRRRGGSASPRSSSRPRRSASTPRWRARSRPTSACTGWRATSSRSCRSPPASRPPPRPLGWDLTTLSYDPSDPQGPSAAMQQAVDGGADYIAVSGQTVDILGQALDAAKSAGDPGHRALQHRRDRRRRQRHLRQHRQPGLQRGVVPAARRPGDLRLRRRRQGAGRQRPRLRRSSDVATDAIGAQFEHGLPRLLRCSRST